MCVSEKKTKMEKDRNKIAEDMVSVALHLMKTSNWSYSHVSECVLPMGGQRVKGHEVWNA